MQVSVIYTCESCGAKFGSRAECLRHEAMCGDHPDDGIYRSEVMGQPVFIRVDRGNDRVTAVTLRENGYRVDTLNDWCPLDGMNSVSEASAVLEIHRFLSAREGSVLEGLGLPPYTRPVPKKGADE